MKKRYLLLSLLLSVQGTADDLNPEPYQAQYRLSYEQVSISPSEDMGLTGLSVLFDFNEYWYGGATIYGAVKGERGGFFTVGAESGLHYPVVENFEINTGLFVGAGGGGAAPQGGGLMVRPYLGTTYVKEDYSLGVGVSYINFPNGDIESTQLYVSAALPVNGVFLSGHQFFTGMKKNTIQNRADRTVIETSLLVEHYRPTSKSVNRSGDEALPFTLAGLEVNAFLNQNLYTSFQLAGAGSGSSDGYMEVFTGLGYRYPWVDTALSFDLHAAIGASGGGNVDTGGGLVYRVDAGLYTKFTEHLSVGLKGGYVDAFDGTFAATSIRGSLDYTGSLLKDVQNISSFDSLQTLDWSVRAIHKSYLQSDTLFKDSERDERIDLLGVAIDYYLSRNIYLSGQTFWAYNGSSGGYAEGVVGLGYHSDMYEKFSFYTEVLGIVAGGGGVNVGGGAMGSLGLGLNYTFNKSWEASVGSAYVRSKEGALRTANLTFGIDYKFSLLADK